MCSSNDIKIKDVYVRLKHCSYLVAGAETTTSSLVSHYTCRAHFMLYWSPWQHNCMCDSIFGDVAINIIFDWVLIVSHCGTDSVLVMFWTGCVRLPDSDETNFIQNHKISLLN